MDWDNISDSDQEIIIGLGAALAGILGTLFLRKIYSWLFPARVPAIQNQNHHHAQLSAGSSLEGIPLQQAAALPAPQPAAVVVEDPIQTQIDSLQLQINHLSDLAQDQIRKHQQLQKFAVTRIARLEVKNNRQ